MRRVEVCDTQAEEVGFAGAQQIGRLTRESRLLPKKITQAGKGQGPPAVAAPTARSDWLITSLEPSRLDATALLADKRAYWGIENGLHQRLDGTIFDEDRSRVRTPNSALLLAMFRRTALSLACDWIQRQPNPRLATTRGFVETMSGAGSGLAFALVTAQRPRRPPI